LGVSYLLDVLAQFLERGARKLVHRFLAIPPQSLKSGWSPSHW